MGWAAEPGYYEDGAFGIRIENVMVVKMAEVEGRFGDKQFLEFEPITWVRNLNPNLNPTWSKEVRAVE